MIYFFCCEETPTLFYNTILRINTINMVFQVKPILYYFFDCFTRIKYCDIVNIQLLMFGNIGC